MERWKQPDRFGGTVPAVSYFGSQFSCNAPGCSYCDASWCSWRVTDLVAARKSHSPSRRQLPRKRREQDHGEHQPERSRTFHGRSSTQVLGLLNAGPSGCRPRARPSYAASIFCRLRIFHLMVSWVPPGITRLCRWRHSPENWACFLLGTGANLEESGV